MDSLKFYALLRAVEHGSLTKAAEELGYTQAGLTHMMNRLEKEIGITLLQRTKSGVTLTPDGKKLLPLIRSFSEQGLKLEKAIRNLTENNDTVIRIASYASITNHWLPVIISNFQKDFPKVRFELHVGNHDEICRLVSDDEIDLGFTSKQDILHGDWIHLQNDPLYAVLPPDCEIDSESVPVSIFNNKAFFMPTYGFDYDIMKTLKENNLNPLINRTALDDATVVSMVSHGLGYSILPKLVLTGMAGSFIAKPIEPQTSRELGILIKSKNNLSPVAHKFINYCKQQIK
ncbi:MAG: LysR family transcriptional regulator [Acutalibacteraceae bacterium]|nr:LysR family transcriptional regulator [Acutalibacteraceae bacterium]